MDGICGNGDCVNLNGTYACECYDGYELNALGKCEGAYIVQIFLYDPMFLKL